MPYKQMNWSPGDFDVNPLQSFQGGLSLIQQAKIRELEMQQMRAKQFLAMQEEQRAQAREPLALEQLRASTEQMKNAEQDRRRGARAEAIQKAAILRKQGAHSEANAVLQAVGLKPSGEEDVFGPAPAPSGVASPRSPAQGGPPNPEGPRPTWAAEIDQLPGQREGWADELDQMPDQQAIRGDMLAPVSAGAQMEPPKGPVIGKKYKYTDESGGEYTIDTSERGQFEEQQRKDAIARLDGMDLQQVDPGIAKLLPTIKEGIRGGILKPEQGFKEMLDWANEQARHEVGMANATRPRANPLGGQRLGLSEEAGARAFAKDILAGTGFKESQVQNKKFNDMAAMLSADPNAALDAVLAGTFVKQAQGGTGVISDSDMNQFWNSIGGVEAKAEGWIEKALSGQITPEKRAQVAAAVQRIAAIAKGNLDNTRQAMEYGFANSPHLSKYGAQMTGTFFPEARENPLQAAARRGKAPAGKAATSATVPAAAIPEGTVKTAGTGRTFIYTGGKWKLQKAAP
jgi:hypothetical protein